MSFLACFWIVTIFWHTFSGHMFNSNRWGFWREKKNINAPTCDVCGRLPFWRKGREGNTMNDKHKLGIWLDAGELFYPSFLTFIHSFIHSLSYACSPPPVRGNSIKNTSSHVHACERVCVSFKWANSNLLDNCLPTIYLLFFEIE